MQLKDMVIDGLEFARRGNHAHGAVAVASLSRVAESLACSEGELDCDISGTRSADGHLELRVQVEGELQLRCQRCLDAMPFPLHVERRLRLMAPGAVWLDEELEEEAFDAVEASKEMAVGSLIEDEVLLALPIAPRHDVCGTPRRMDTQHDASPFAVLRNLKLD